MVLFISVDLKQGPFDCIVSNNLNFLISSSVIKMMANSSFKVANELKFLRGESDGNKTKRN